MFGEQKLEISFGPWQDIALMIFVFLGIFMFGSFFVQSVIDEVKSWFGKGGPTAKNDEPPIRYEVLWSPYLQPDGGTEQLRISSSVEEATAALLQENGEGFIRYRPFIKDEDFDWGMAMWRTSESSELLYTHALAGMREYKGVEKDEEWDIEQSTAVPDSKPTTWFVEWSNNEDFSMETGISTTFVTDLLSRKIHEIIAELGPGYIRYRETATDSWTPNGYVTKESLNA